MLSFSIGFSQNLEQFSSENSMLPENDIWSITTDLDGRVWIGTSKSGLVSLHHGVFKIYNDSTSNFKGSFIGPLFTDSNGVLWVSASRPNALYTFEDENFSLIQDPLLLSMGGIISIVEDKNGTMYFGCTNGLIKYENDHWTKIDLPTNKITIRALAINELGEIAIGHNNGLIIGNGNDFVSYSESESELQLSVVRSLKYISNKKLIIGYGGGFGNGGFSIKKENKWKHYNRENSGIANHMVRDIEIDKENTFWMATNEGLTIMKNKKIETIFFREGRMKNTIMDIAIHENNIWIATNFGVLHIVD